MDGSSDRLRRLHRDHNGDRGRGISVSRPGQPRHATGGPTRRTAAAPTSDERGHCGRRPRRRPGRSATESQMGTPRRIPHPQRQGTRRRHAAVRRHGGRPTPRSDLRHRHLRCRPRHVHGSLVPAGVGAVEASTSALLVAAGTSLGGTAVAVGRFRVFDVWIPVLVGALAARTLRTAKQAEVLPVLAVVPVVEGELGEPVRDSAQAAC